MHNSSLEKKGHIMHGVVVGEEKLEVILSNIGVTINDVIVVINGKLENNPDRVVLQNDRILIIPALEGG